MGARLRRLLYLLAACGLLGAGGAAADVPVPTPAQWQADLDHLGAQVPRVHANAFHFASRQDFERALAELRVKAAVLSTTQMEVGIQRVIAMLGDGHSRFDIRPLFHSYPFAFLILDGEVRVGRAGPGLERTLGKRLVAIDGVPVAAVRARLRTLIPQGENDFFILNQEQRLLVMAEDLYALGISRDATRATFRFADDANEFDLAATAAAPGQVIAWRNALPPMMAYSNVDEAMRFADLPGTNAVYLNFRNYSAVQTGAAAVFRHIDQVRADGLVIDLRFNSGGDFTLPRRFILPELARRPALRKPGRVIVLVGRQTFSAAMTNALDLKKAGAVLIGEPIGARPNGYQENGSITLPNSGLRISVSTRRYAFWPVDIDAVQPDVSAAPHWADLASGHDVALETATARFGRKQAVSRSRSLLRTGRASSVR